MNKRGVVLVQDAVDVGKSAAQAVEASYMALCGKMTIRS
jgi:hypothetical protein